MMMPALRPRMAAQAQAFSQSCEEVSALPSSSAWERVLVEKSKFLTE